MDLILLAGESDPSPYAALEKEADCVLLPCPCDDWNRDLSPWPAPPAFKKGEAFAGGAPAFLSRVLEQMAAEEARLSRPVRRRLIAGYSLAGLFALWALCETPLLRGAACASSSLWYPGFLPYLRSRTPLGREAAAALSLGDREEFVKNPVLAGVGQCTRETEALLKARGIPCSLRMEEGNHFRDEQGRLLRALRDLLALLPEESA